MSLASADQRRTTTAGSAWGRAKLVHAVRRGAIPRFAILARLVSAGSRTSGELFHAVASAEPALLVVKCGYTREPHVRVAQLAEMPHARHQRQPCARADVLLQVSSDLRWRHRVSVAPADVHRLFHEGERRQPARLFEALAVLEVLDHQVVHPVPVL